MKKVNVYCIERITYYVKWLCFTSVIYFLFVGVEECVWIKRGNICKTIGNIINDICIELCIFIICIVYYEKKIKFKKLKIALWILLCSIIGIACNTCISNEIKIMFFCERIH